MVYRELHKPEKKRDISRWTSSDHPGTDDLSPEATKRDYPPSDEFLYVLPSIIKGFNLKKKKWLDLKVDNLGEVVWNETAFERLVLEDKTKKLILALVSDQVESTRSTDLISGKGNGLIMLLHGGPGTGKTLTAESVAEIARKPLYPVTCGDIGTEPEAVENYLESVLHLGKTWGCVVLLDEADVFLEQRSLQDLHRNALVSVFLRVLEYYEGILVLTSNRVGTFDEAFKSRIQLAIHYNGLSFYERSKIWGNFISRLQDFKEEEIDADDLKDHIKDLAQFEMNGREIRNAITNARQYTRWERKQQQQQQQGPENCKLDYAKIKLIIDTASKFDDYIKKLNGGYNHIAVDEGLRLEA
ncbi:P-loop containing nucleoside triphosphate hydrolase protein [Daldinia decipiens]|uniref:P-loop containing nucleoside triphosphate hydrolase protein n=1 Tax=Daldinia decipiens TaxID=326647 RepID=UPI0020C44E8D|nr:P-loop containing nucleoside triphosphate hydrolase protein [Daldinia decipiens]KAI1654075.1 P-loop containing nucleoside triphosphate hydrolase protein [Daldinia decipiens]